MADFNAAYETNEPTGSTKDAEPTDPVVTIDLILDTGHHYAFVPIALEEGGTDAEAAFASLPGLPNLSDTTLQKLRVLVTREGWRSNSNLPWIKARLETRQGTFKHSDTGRRETITLLGVVAAIETNIGGATRGYVLRDRKLNIAVDEKPEAREIPESPFVATHEGELPDSRIVLPLHSLFEFDQVEGWNGEANLGLIWRSGAAEPVDVDIVVDFGNSRTNVLALEYARDARQSLREICRPISFASHQGLRVEGEDGPFMLLQYDSEALDDVLPGSWFILQQPVFQSETGDPTTLATYELATEKGGLLRGAKQKVTQEKLYVPDAFRELSPAVMGVEAKEKLRRENASGQDDLDRLSSPKRYIWDRDPTGRDRVSHWKMRPQSWFDVAGAVSIPKLRGELLNFMDRELMPYGKGWPQKVAPFRRGAAGAPDPQGMPDHPKAAGMVFAALKIIETAYRQINSPEWRRNNGADHARRIRSILLTSPPGWTGDEANALYQLWVLARCAFFDSRCFPKGTEPPKINLSLDEALAAQLPFVFSEINHLGNDAGMFVELYGRKTAKGGHAVRVMTIDIGGGTTDTCVVEYTEEGQGGQNRLIFDPIFRDSSNRAGDLLVRTIIEGAILPSLIVAADSDITDRARTFFGGGGQSNGVRMDLISRFVFIPLALRLLKDIQRKNTPLTGPSLSEVEGASEEHLKALNTALSDAGLDACRLDWSEELPISYDKVTELVRAWLDPLAEEHARYAAAFGADMIVLTGKPSEMDLVAKVFEAKLPIHPERIISANGYFAGAWAPLTGDGRIKDAKLVTALGAALYRALTERHITNWTLRKAKRTREPQRYNWGSFDIHRPRFKKKDLILSADQDQNEMELAPESFIGRALFLSHSAPEQVYQLRWRGADEDKPEGDVKVTFKRSQPGANPEHEQSALEISERLELVDQYIRKDGEWVPTSHLELMLCTLPSGEEHWLDKPRFQIG